MALTKAMASIQSPVWDVFKLFAVFSLQWFVLGKKHFRNEPTAGLDKKISATILSQ